MATIFYGPDSKIIDACKAAEEWCLSNGIENADCRISNYLFPKFKCLSGNTEALDFIERNLKKFRIRSIKRIRNAPALHCSLMAPAIEPFTKALQQIHIDDPLIRVYSNVNFKPYWSAAHILKQLPQQICSPIRWEQTMHYIYARSRGISFPRTIVCGPGFSLKSILKNVNLRAWRRTVHIGDTDAKRIKKRMRRNVETK